MKQPKKPTRIKAQQATPEPDLRNISESEDEVINLSLDLIRGAERGGLYLMSGGKYFKISEHDADLVEAAAKALISDRGCPTPIENFINGLPRNTHYCALSALGHSPVWTCGNEKCNTVNAAPWRACPKCQTERGKAPLRLSRKPEPYRVRDPLFWIFREAGVM